MAKTAEATVRLSLIDHVTGPIKRISARLSALGKKIGLDRIGASVMRLGAAFRGLGDGLARSTARLTSLLTLLGAGGAGIVTAAYNIAKSTADIGAEINDTAFKLGIGVEALQEFRYAANLSSVETATLDKAIEKLGVNAVSANKGNKGLSEAFKELGVRVKQANGKIRPTENILSDVLLKLAAMKDPLKRNALAFKLFGKSGVDVTKMLGDGADGLEAARREARELGFVMGESATKLGDEFGDNVDKLKLRLTGLKYFLGVQLIPVFNELVLATSGWIKENATLIRSTLTDWVKRLGDFLRDLMDPTSEVRKGIRQLGESFSSFLEKIKPVVDFLGGPMNTALAAIGLWVLLPTIAAVASLAAAFVSLGVAVAGTVAQIALLSFKGLAGMFKSTAATAATNGAVAGTAYGNAFSKAAKLGMIGLGAWAAYEIMKDMPTTKEEWQTRLEENKKKDQERGKSLMDNGGNTINKVLGFELLRPKDDFQNSPAKKLLDTIKGWMKPKESAVPSFVSDFKFSAAKPGTGKTSDAVARDPAAAARDAASALNSSISNVISLENALKARQAGMGRTTDTLPGKTKDDLGIGSKVSSLTVGNLNMPEPIVAHEPQTVNAPFTVNLSITAASDKASDIAGAVKSALAAQAAKQAAAVKSSLSD